MTRQQHARWCITQCPCFPAEMTIWWFLHGSRAWDPWIAELKYRDALTRIIGKAQD